MSFYSEVMADSPIAYWRLGETSGTTADNAEGTATYDGTYVNTPTLGATGALAGDADTAITLNGSDEYVSVAYNSALQPAAWSFECIVKWSSITGPWHHIASTDVNDTGTGWRLFYRPLMPGNPDRLCFARGAQSDDWYCDIAPSLDTWYHIVAVYDGTNNKVYINGASGGSATSWSVTTNTLALFMGAEHGSDGTGFQNPHPGGLDECVLYGSALSAARVAAHYAAISALDFTPTDPFGMSGFFGV